LLRRLNIAIPLRSIWPKKHEKIKNSLFFRCDRCAFAADSNPLSSAAVNATGASHLRCFRASGGAYLSGRPSRHQNTRRTKTSDQKTSHLKKHHFIGLTFSVSLPLNFALV